MNKAKKAQLKSVVYRAFSIGDQMSNVCFSLAQDDKQSHYLRKIFAECRVKWDEAESKAREELSKL